MFFKRGGIIISRARVYLCSGEDIVLEKYLGLLPSVYLTPTSSASLPFSLSSEKKIDWEWAAQSVHWGHWWSGCHDPPSSTQKTWRASTTWTPTPMMDGQVGGAFASGLSADGSAGGDHTLVSASCQGWQLLWHRVYRDSWGQGAADSLGPWEILAGTLASSCFLTQPHCLCLGLSSYSWREKDFFFFNLFFIKNFCSKRVKPGVWWAPHSALSLHFSKFQHSALS